MAPPTLQDALTPRTVASERGLLLAELAASGSNVSGWSDGAPQRAFLEGEARALSAESDLRAAIASTASVDLVIAAGPSWVDAMMTWYRITRIPASYAVWQVPLQITVALGTLTINAASAIQLQSQSGVVYTCTQASAVVINAGTSYKGTAQFTARTAGTAGNVSGTTINKVILGPAGLSVDLGGTFTETSVARNAEGDADFIVHGLGKWARLGAGWTLPAFDYLIPFYGNNSANLNVTRWYVDDSNPNGPGTIQVYLANAAGAATGPEVAAVDAGLNSPSVKPLGTGAATVVAATDHALVITATILTSGANPSVGTQAEDVLVTKLSPAFPIGPATLEPDLVRELLMGAAVGTVTIATAPGETEQIYIGAPGFSSVIAVTALSLVVPEAVALGEVLTITAIITVTT